MLDLHEKGKLSILEWRGPSEEAAACADHPSRKAQEADAGAAPKETDAALLRRMMGK